MDCTQINEPDLLVNFFRQEDGPTLTRVLNCFKTLHYKYVRLGFQSSVFDRWTSTRYKEEELSQEAFNDGLLDFYFAIKKNGFEKKATVRHVLSTFCRNKLLGLATTLRRRSEKYATVDPSEKFEHSMDTASQPKMIAEEIRAEQERILKIRKLAFSQMDERSGTLLFLRKWKKMSNEEIASQVTSLKPSSVTNEVFKSFKELKTLADQLDKKDRLWNSL